MQRSPGLLQAKAQEFSGVASVSAAQSVTYLAMPSWAVSVATRNRGLLSASSALLARFGLGAWERA